MGCPPAPGLLLFFCLFVASAWGCTYFEIPDGDNYVVARSMEYAVLPFNITDWVMVTHPVGDTYGMPPTQRREVSIGHVSVDFNLAGHVLSFDVSAVAAAIDGMNERGLSISCNTFKSSKYAAGWPGNFADRSKVLWFGDLARWGLSNFESANDMVEALKEMTVISLGAPSMLLGLHWAVADRFGASYVIEYMDGTGKPMIHNNTVRVMTNDPDYRWQVLNLNNYDVLTPNDPKSNDPLRVPTDFGSPYDMVPGKVSEGANLRGLPGDTTPPARFVRMFYLRGYAMLNAPPCGDRACKLTLAQALLNEDFIPRGVESRASPRVPIAFSQWAMLKVPHTQTLMYRSYVNMEWKMIDLKRLNLADSRTKSKRLVVEDNLMDVVDITERFMDSPAKSETVQDLTSEWTSRASSSERRLSIPCDMLATCGVEVRGTQLETETAAEWSLLTVSPALQPFVHGVSLLSMGSLCFLLGRYSQSKGRGAVAEQA
eukprot:TRINITY_DN42010_c0_g1_i1.p1 TRINITY_DN42010_c0_g1~~TRINITY_DN42010_c0_g1_i1.p1  ORF type:complete len:486 (+),score=70.33 TRINITY_DN42010_c0_g1_i1:82-1539(+)